MGQARADCDVRGVWEAVVGELDTCEAVPLLR